MPITQRRRALAIVFTALVVGGSALGLAAPAQAHNYLVSSTPAEGEVLTTLPAEFSVTTNAPLLALDGSNGFALQVVDAAGAYYGDGCLTVAGASLSTPAALGEAGDYRLIWQVVSEDGHPVSGELAFSWQPVDASAATRGSAAPPVCGETAVEPIVVAPIGPANPDASPEPSVTAVPISEPEVRQNASLSDVLWIGGAIMAVLAAALVTLLVVGRRRRN